MVVAFFVLLDHCSLEALAFASQRADAPNPTMEAHNAVTSEEPCHHRHRNNSHSEGANDDCDQMSCCTNIKAEIASKDIFLTSAGHKNFQFINDLREFLAVESDNLPQPVSNRAIGPPGFLYQVPFYQSAFASQAPPQA
jgi:hypothetical protein